MEKNYFQQQTPQKNIKRVYYEEVTDSEGEDGSNTNTPVEENTEQRQKKTTRVKQKKKNLFEYLNKDTKRNKQ